MEELFENPDKKFDFDEWWGSHGGSVERFLFGEGVTSDDADMKLAARIQEWRTQEIYRLETEGFVTWLASDEPVFTGILRHDAREQVELRVERRGTVTAPDLGVTLSDSNFKALAIRGIPRSDVYDSLRWPRETAGVKVGLGSLDDNPPELWRQGQLALYKVDTTQDELEVRIVSPHPFLMIQPAKREYDENAELRDIPYGVQEIIPLLVDDSPPKEAIDKFNTCLFFSCRVRRSYAESSSCILTIRSMEVQEMLAELTGDDLLLEIECAQRACWPVVSESNGHTVTASASTDLLEDMDIVVSISRRQ